MTSTDYIKENRVPLKWDKIWSPHSFIFKRGYPYVHKVLNVEKKKRNGTYQYLLTVKSTMPSGAVFAKEQTLWLDELD
tara:strand:+ start:1139 stop:1372 length:234 start_codon:yes stop_codon:yes gene_type:complete